jgi:hypothetical protein
MPRFSNLLLPQWLDESDGPINPPAIHPDGLLGGFDFVAAGADADSWINGTHVLSRVMQRSSHGGPPEDRARGIGKALEGTKLAAEGTHGFGAMTALAAGASRTAPAIEGLEMVNRGFVYPLTIGKGVADTFSDVRGGAPLGEAIVGNGLRSGWCWAGRRWVRP